MQTSFLRGHWESDWEQFLSCLEKGAGEDLNSDLNLIEEHHGHHGHVVLRGSVCEVEWRLTGPWGRSNGWFCLTDGEPCDFVQTGILTIYGLCRTCENRTFWYL